MWPSDEEYLSNMDGWKIYAYLQTKTIFIANQILDFFPALLDSPSWIILLATILVVLPLIWLLVKLIQWIRQPLDSIQAVKVCFNSYLLLVILFEDILCNNWFHFETSILKIGRTCVSFHFNLLIPGLFLMNIKHVELSLEQLQRQRPRAKHCQIKHFSNWTFI